jgi:hypothetical protein
LKDTIGGESDKYSIKGITPGYVIDEIESNFNSNNKVERNDLIKNDCFALY